MASKEDRAFAREMMKLCKKHGVSLSAHGEGYVCLTIGGKPSREGFSEFRFSATSAELGGEFDANRVVMSKDDV